MEMIPPKKALPPAPIQKVLKEELEQIETSRAARLNPEENRGSAREGLTGLAFSGGGIRSATFNLGVLQALAEKGLLCKFDYLSTVSGGGYIGSWLMGWMHHQKKGVREIEARLAPHTYSAEKTAEPPEVRFLRNFSNYLTPRKGILSADFWAFVANYLRNTLLNQLILLLFLLGLLLLPRVITYLPHFLEAGEEALKQSWDDVPDILRSQWLAIIIGFGLGAIGVAEIALNFCWIELPPPVRSRWERWLSRSSAIQCLIVVPLFLSAAFLSYAFKFVLPDLRGACGYFSWVAHLGLSPCAVWAPGLGVVLYTLLWVFACIVRWVALFFLPAARGKGPDWRLLLFTAVITGAVIGFLFIPYAAVLQGAYDPASASPSGLWKVLTFGTPGLIGIMLTAGALHIGLMGRGFHDPYREWWARLGGWLVIYAVCWLLLFLLAVYVPVWVGWAISKYVHTTLGGALFWILSTLFGVLFGKSPGTNKPQLSDKWKKRLAGYAARATPYIFIAGLLVLLAILDAKIALLPTLTSPAFSAVPSDIVDPGVLWICAFFVLAALGLSWRVDVNQFSTHMMYRNRLVRCYLGASTDPDKRQPFSGFSTTDDIALAEIKPTCVSPEGKPDGRPLPLLNATVNVARGKELALQTRKARSFVFSPLYSGYMRPDPLTSEWISAYAATRKSGSDEKSGEAALTIGTAMAVSGAAASPNMGFYSSRALAFLMTVFDVRLGWWLGNPADKKWTSKGPRFGAVCLLAELFGAASDASAYIYLSDGGHFENLAVYELVRRRCKLIVASDASCDPKYAFGDLHNAMERCRSDFGVEILRETHDLVSKEGRVSGHFDLCRIRYTPGNEADDGCLIYLKPGIADDDPEDLIGYAAQNETFPHDATANQWFDENHFENYRHLGCVTGFAAAEKIAEKMKIVLGA
jgi:hypothetical protein